MAQKTEPKKNIVKGKIANAITSAAKNHIVATTDDLYDVNFEEYQDSINKRLNNSVSGLQGDVAKVKGDVTTVNNKISGIQTDVSNLKGNVSSINSEISRIKGNVSDINGEISRIKSDVTKSKTDITAINREISSMHGDINDVKSLIPKDASSENQLTDKQFVIDLVHSTSSAFRGNWDTWNNVPSNSDEYPKDGEGNKTPRQGDYIVIVDASEYTGEDTGKTYDGTWRFVYEGEWVSNNKNGWKPEYQIGGKSEITIYFRKKKEGESESTELTNVKVSDKNTLLTYPELKYSEFVNGGYWGTDITELRNLSASTVVYYITPLLTSNDNRILLRICYENGWSNSPEYMALNEIQSITDEMVEEAAKRLAVIEDENGNIIPVFDSIIYQANDDTEPIVMTSYSLYDGLCWDKNGNEYQIRDCFCYSKDGVRYDFSKVNYSNCFYELESWTELPYFTGITKLSDGETYRVFLDYSHIRDINLENIASLPAYTLFRCTHLENIFIPSGLTDIETYALASCDGLQSLAVDENNPKYTSRDSNGNECNCVVEKPVTTRGTRSAINNQLTLIQGCNVTILPDNIKHIASGAFDECTRLTSITLPDGLLTMGDNVFRGCTALNGNIIVPDTVESIGESTFRSCTALEGVNINVPVISNYLFKDCTSLSSVTLGNGVTEIGNQAFMNDSSLTAITIPDSVTVAGTGAFNGCDLRSINTNNIETISGNLFANNSNLSSVTMTDTTANISAAAFGGCVALTNITVPQNVASIHLGAFIACINLNQIIWDVNNTSLNDYRGVFAINKATITSFEFGEHCTVIPNGLCQGAINMTGITIPNHITTIGNNVFHDCFLLTNITIPNTVTSIGTQLCRGCTSLETVTIGSGLSTISSQCFSGCTSLETVDLSNNPNKIDLANTNAFLGCNNLSLIIVPDNLITTYRESQDWYDYRELIFGTNVYTITFDSVGGETTPSTQNVRCGAYIVNPGEIHKDLYEFEYWEDEDGNEWNFEEDYVVGDMTLYAHYREIKAIMVKSISNDVTNISMYYNGGYPANVEYSYDGLNWYNIWNSNDLTISLSEGYSDYVYFRGYNPNGFSRDGNNYSWFNINNGQCDLLGNIMYLKNYNEELNYVNYHEFYRLFQSSYVIVNANDFVLPATTLAESCYYHMFNGCTNLTTAPELHATTLTDTCYAGMFSGCTSLTTAPELPATTLANSCYYYMFSNCTSLTTAPVLPATTLALSCYVGMFTYCGSLTTAPVLPATTLVTGCYSNMFAGCTSLTTAPELPATTLANSCYYYMFYNCTSLTTAPSILPATALTNSCYLYMFLGCTSLTTAPELPATTLAGSCYNSMFQGCTSLTTAPELPATALTNSCYYNMFMGCTSLTTAPELPATTLANGCYSSMFYACTGLTAAPELPATTLAQYCYQSMFYYCSSLNYIKCLATNISASNCTSNWVRGVASSGIFIQDASASWDRSVNGIPSNWNIEYTPIDNYITFTSQQDGSTIGLSRLSSNQKLLYSNDNGNTWRAFDTSVSLTVNSGATVFVGGRLSGNNSDSNYTQFRITGGVSVSGNLNSIWNYADLEQNLYKYCGNNLFSECASLINGGLILPATTLAEGCYSNMFAGCTSLTTAPELPATTLTDTCYAGMFAGCSSLTTAPELPATTLATNCYNSMFYDCTSLTEVPELPATTLANKCYCGMFVNCTSLTTAPELPATTLATNCYNSMFQGCTSLTTAPSILPATTLADECYYNMFGGCSRLTTAPVLPATTLANNCYQEMFVSCTRLTNAPELPSTTLTYACYANMFNGCSSLTTAPELPATTLAESCYASMFYGCSSLNYIKCLAISGINTNSNTASWVNGVSNNGTFIQEASASWDRGNNGIPTNWNAGYAPIDNYITFTSRQDGSTIGLFRLSSNQKLLYSNDNGNTWRAFDTSVSLTVNSGATVFVGGRLSGNNSGNNHTQFSISGGVSVSGNLNGLWEYNNLNLPLKPYCGYRLFSACDGLVNASGLTLQATTLANKCYERMFAGCISLTTAPEFPAATLAYGCYSYMFYGCISLTEAPELPATTVADECYSYMFANCKSLTTAPELPATTLAQSCYSSMFSSCTRLTNAPELPSTTLTYACYANMFYNCSSLTAAPELPATNLASSCYYSMFKGCSSLTTAPELPATTLAQSCYNSMFYNCRSLTTAPELPATTLAHGCYSGMFDYCIRLTTASNLPATTLAESCYASMFSGCTSLTTAPELPATNLAGSCYYGMFEGCRNLTTAPELPATILANECYSSMFNGCTDLTTAPELPATELASSCYSAMFAFCKSLTTAPELHATTLTSHCYYSMFSGCSRLNYIKCLATSGINQNDSTSGFVEGVANQGTFVQDARASWPTGSNGIPENWTIEDAIIEE